MTYVLTFPERKLQWPYSTFGVTSFDVTISRTRLGDREVFQYCETNVKTSQNKTHQKRLVAITWSFRNISSSHWRNWNLKPTNISEPKCSHETGNHDLKQMSSWSMAVYLYAWNWPNVDTSPSQHPPQAGWKTVTFESRSVLLGWILVNDFMLVCHVLMLS